MMKLIVPAILMFASSQALAQNDPAQVQQPQQQQAQTKKPRLICHDIEETGSRLSQHRICMTADQWKDQQERDRENVADFQQNSTVPE